MNLSIAYVTTDWDRLNLDDVECRDSWWSLEGSEQQRDYNNRIREHEGRSSGAERDLIEKYRDIYSYDAPCHPGHASSWPCVIFDWNHLLPPSTLTGIYFLRRGKYKCDSAITFT